MLRDGYVADRNADEYGIPRSEFRVRDNALSRAAAFIWAFLFFVNGLALLVSVDVYTLRAAGRRLKMVGLLGLCFFGFLSMLDFCSSPRRTRERTHAVDDPSPA